MAVYTMPGDSGPSSYGIAERLNAGDWTSAIDTWNHLIDAGADPWALGQALGTMGYQDLSGFYQAGARTGPAAPAPAAPTAPAAAQPAAPAPAPFTSSDPVGAFKTPTTDPPRAVGSTPPSTPAPFTGPAVDPSARSAINATLESVGLGELGDWAWNEFLNGAPVAQILLDMRKTSTWQNRYGVIDQLAKQGVTGISEADVINYRATVRQVLASAAIPSGFFDSQSELDQFMVHGKSAAEISANVKQAQQASLSAPQETRDALQRLYGVHPGELAAFWLDPTTATDLINQRYTSAQLAGTAAQTGYGQLDQSQAERLAALGISTTQAQQGFSQLGQQAELFKPLTAAEGAIGTDEQLAAVFGGDAATQEQIRRRQAARQAVFGAGGGVSQSREGLAGLGARQQ